LANFFSTDPLFREQEKMQASLWLALDAVAVKVKNMEKGLNSGKRSAGRNGKNNNCNIRNVV
jgi:hypothetical protein